MKSYDDMTNDELAAEEIRLEYLLQDAVNTDQEFPIQKKLMEIFHQYYQRDWTPEVNKEGDDLAAFVSEFDNLWILPEWEED